MGRGWLGLVLYMFNILGLVPAVPHLGSTMFLLWGWETTAVATLLCTVLTDVCFHASSPPLCISRGRTSLASLLYFFFIFSRSFLPI